MLLELGKISGRGREGVSFEDVFHAIPTGAYRFNPNNESIANASPDGILIGNPQFTITYKFADDYYLPYNLIHEIIHGSAREGKNYTHFEMADATWTVGGRRYEYGPNFVRSYAAVNNVADEAYSLQVFDGAGRVIAGARNHPGSSGGYSGQLIVYDNMGRVSQQSNPTETSLSVLNPAWSQS